MNKRKRKKLKKKQHKSMGEFVRATKPMVDKVIKKIAQNIINRQ